MLPPDPLRIGYVVKRYPRYSETFIVNEILAHEEAGLALEIFSLYPPNDTHFQDIISRVRAPVSYLAAASHKAADFWGLLDRVGSTYPEIWSSLSLAQGEDVRDVYQALRLAIEVRQRGIHHLHAHFATSAASVARLASLFTGIPYSLTAHAKDIFHESVCPRDLERKLSDAAAVVTVSDYNLDYLREHYGIAAIRAQRIYNGLELERFPFSAPLERAASIVAVGRLVEKKGFPDLLEACAVLVRRGIDVGCKIIGTGPLEESLRSQIELLGLQDYVSLLGPRPQREVIAQLQRASVFAAPCVIGEDGNRDGLPTVLLEAMAVGTPCVSTAVTGIPEVLEDGKTGLVVPQRDPPALATALEQLLHNPCLRVKLAERARQKIESDFNIHRNAAQLREIFASASKQYVPRVGAGSACV